jgi:two-component system sensor histidine kinase KdpD
MEQAFSRLVCHALEAAGEEGAVSVEVSTSDGNKEMATVVVRAPGLDIADEDMAVVFGPSAAVLTEKPSSGKALGLAVARALIEMHGGRIWVEEDSTGQSVINFTVPRHRATKGGPDVIVGIAAAGEVAEAAPA